MAKRTRVKLSVLLELIELRQAVIDHCKDLRAICDALGKGQKTRAVRILGSATERLEGVSLRHAKAHGYTPLPPKARKRSGRKAK